MLVRRQQAEPGTVTTGDGVTLATLDWRGHGPDVVLLHGLGPTQQSMRRLAAALTPAFRVVTYDQRCVGASSVGPWTFPTAVADLRAVIDSRGLTNPFVVGHSLGGMIALMYAAEHRDAPGVVNIDGWGPGRPEQYVGEDPDAVREVLKQISDLRLNSRIGRAAVALLERKPSVRRAKAMRERVVAALWELDVVGLHRQVSCPVLAFNCVAPPAPGTRRMLGAEAVRMLQAQRRGLRLELEALRAERSNVTVVEVNASHLAVARRPEPFASQIRQLRRGQPFRPK